MARHARLTLVVTISALAFLVLGMTLLANWTHAIPYTVGTPTVVSQEVAPVFGHGPIGNLAVLRGAVGDRADLLHRRQHQLQRLPLPGQLRGRGQVLAQAADQARPPPGLLQRHHRPHHRGHHPHLWPSGPTSTARCPLRHRGVHRVHHGRARHGQALSCTGRRGVAARRVHQRPSAFLSALVVLIFARKFREGAWLVAIVGPALFRPHRLHRQYKVEAAQLEEGAAQAAEAPILAVTRWWCWWTGWTWPRRGPSSTPAHSIRTTSGPSTSPSTPSPATPSRRSGAGWGCPTSPSTSRSARTDGSPGRPWSWRRRRWPTARRSSPSSCPDAGEASAWQRVLHDNTAEHIATA